MTAGQSIDYDAMTQQALRGVVRTVLTAVAKTGLPGEHHFFIAFDTRAPGVTLSRRLKEKYPEEMMIVLQHRFWDLAVSDERFEVKLTFDGIPERLVVPFSALKLFFDPSVRYTLQFEDAAHVAEDAGEVLDRIGPREIVSEGETEAPRPVRKTGERRPRPKAVPTDTSERPKAEPAPPIALNPRAVEPPAENLEPATEPATAAPPHPLVIAPAPTPSGAKVVSIDSWRNKK